MVYVSILNHLVETIFIFVFLHSLKTPSYFLPRILSNFFPYIIVDYNIWLINIFALETANQVFLNFHKP